VSDQRADRDLQSTWNSRLLLLLVTPRLNGSLARLDGSHSRSGYSGKYKQPAAAAADDDDDDDDDDTAVLLQLVFHKRNSSFMLGWRHSVVVNALASIIVVNRHWTRLVLR